MFVAVAGPHLISLRSPPSILPSIARCCCRLIFAGNGNSLVRGFLIPALNKCLTLEAGSTGEWVVLTFSRFVYTYYTRTTSDELLSRFRCREKVLQLFSLRDAVFYECILFIMSTEKSTRFYRHKNSRTKSRVRLQCLSMKILSEDYKKRQRQHLNLNTSRKA